MPDEEKKMVDIDTSGPGAEVDLPEEKVKETEAESKPEAAQTKTEETRTTEQETQIDVQEEKKEQPVKDDDKLEEYSKGVQSRIAKLTRKMREAERQRDAATEYALSLIHI